MGKSPILRDRPKNYNRLLIKRFILNLKIYGSIPRHVSDIKMPIQFNHEYVGMNDLIRPLAAIDTK